MDKIFVLREFVDHGFDDIVENGTGCYSSMESLKKALYEYWQRDITENEFKTFRWYQEDEENPDNWHVIVPEELTDSLNMYRLYYVIETCPVDSPF